MRKLAVLCLSALTAVSLAACGNSSQNRAENRVTESRRAATEEEPGDNGAESPGQNTENAQGSTMEEFWWPIFLLWKPTAQTP